MLYSPPLEPSQVVRTRCRNPKCTGKLKTREHIKRGSAKAIFQRESPPLVIGGYRFPNAPEIDLSPLPLPEPAKPIQPLSPELLDDEGTGIPRFLRRAREASPTPAASSPEVRDA